MSRSQTGVLPVSYAPLPSSSSASLGEYIRRVFHYPPQMDFEITFFQMLWIANTRLRAPAVHSVEQEVEWMFAFDIHCNSFFLLFLLLHVVQYLLLPLLLSASFLACLLANSLYAFAFGCYFYITFLGYSGLPFLHRQNTVCFLYPIAPLAILLVLGCIFGINASVLAVNIHLTLL